MNSIKALLFDLGGVIIDIDFNNVFERWAGSANCNVEKIQSNYKMDKFYEAHERGEIDFNDYAASLRHSLNIDITDEQFKQGWNSIFRGVIPGIADILNSAKQTWPLYAFTNSNQTHQQTWSKEFSAILSHFNTIFDSSDLGKRKPEPEAFNTVINAIGFEAHQIVFYDDSYENITGAKKVGLHAVHVHSIADIEASIHELLQ